MSSATAPMTAPIAPTSVADLNVRRTLVEDLFLKALFNIGEMSLRELGDYLCLKMSVMDELFNKLRKEQLCEVTGMSTGVHRIVSTTAGKSRAQTSLASSQYVGPVPVSLNDYIERVHAQSVRDMDLRHSDVERAFSHLVIEPGMMAQIGTSAVSGRAVFLYGPAGTGKTSIAEAMATVYKTDHVWIPHCIEIDGQVVSIFDPTVHGDVTQPESYELDRRWVLCHRPRVVTGGELTIEMLDLQYNPQTRFYTAPVQMKANNGLLLIDDFGRQRIRPEELLNRWVVPLDRRVDFLTMAGGKKVEMPFDVFVVFATNLEPKDLVDEAFLRRIQTKIHVGVITPEQFHAIFKRVCADNEMPYDPGAIDTVIELITRQFGQPLRPCHPRDLVNQIRWGAKFNGTRAEMDRSSLAQACANYFIET